MLIVKIFVTAAIAILSIETVGILYGDHTVYGELTPIELKNAIYGPITKEGILFTLFEYKTKENITLYSNSFFELNRTIDIEGKIININNGSYAIFGKINSINLSKKYT